ncbi:terminase small subunit [Qingshengfaniella alkalisoli]|uniref:DNA packaging protein n=1 Tax=Qingshengfaniella alkalisoli TaxID=2599296 RepID=A0A5B8IWS4_9RHOB|nr:terminase small subunit [Qingshengfaniella alkalisoli]QDY70013.1 DNA packaging protein [Qingshengfaniella alkalisoli]
MRIMQELPGLEGERAVARIGGADLCNLLRITPAALTGLVKRDLAIKLGHDAYDLQETVGRYTEHLRSVASGRGGEEQALTLTGERARLARAQADAQETKNAALRGELVKASEVEREWADTLRHLRSQLLAVPSRIRQTLGHLSTADVEAIDRELRDTLTRLGNGDAD